MITENLAVLKINVYKTQEQYDREKEAGNINESEMHLTPEGEGVTKDELDEAIAKLSEEIAYQNEEMVKSVNGFAPDENGEVTIQYEVTTEKDYRHSDLSKSPKTITVYADEQYTNNPYIFLGKNYWPTAIYTKEGFNKFGLTYNTDGHAITVKGTATTGASFSLVDGDSNNKWTLPTDIVEGDVLQIHLFGKASENNSPFFKFEFYDEFGKRIDYTQTRLNAGQIYSKSGLLTVPSNVSYVMFHVAFSTGNVFENTIFPVLVKSNTIVINNAQFTDGYAEVRVDVEASDVCTAPYSSTVKYMLDIPKYIDFRIDEVDFNMDEIDKRISFVSPEMFGAYGDNKHDDSVAVQACIDYAIVNKIKMIGGKTYRTNAPLVITGDMINIDISTIIYTGVDCAVIVNGSYNNIRIGSIFAENGTGFRINSDINSCYGQYYIGRVYTKNNCIEYIVTQKDIVCNRLTFGELYSTGGGNCIYQSPQSTLATGGKWNGNNNFIGGRLSKGEWGVYNAHGEDSYITFHFEGVKNGIRMMGVGNCRVIAPRYTELIHEAYDTSVEGYPLIDGQGILFKYVPPVSVWKYEDTRRTQIEMSPSGGSICPVNIDLSDMNTEYVFEDGAVGSISKDQQGPHVIYANLVSRTGFAISRSFLIFGKHILVKTPVFKRTFHVTENDSGYGRDYRETGLEEEFKIYSKFIIDENGCDYTLPPSYDNIAFNKFEIEQPEGCYATFRDWRGTVIFDGAVYGAGLYELQAYKRDENRYDDYENSNQIWEIRKVANNIVATMPLTT